MPVELTVEPQSDREVLEKKHTKASKLKKYVWNHENKQEILSCLSLDKVSHPPRSLVTQAVHGDWRFSYFFGSQVYIILILI